MEVRIGAEVILGLAFPICKIAPPSAGDQNFSTDLGVMLEDRNAPPAFSGLGRAHESCGAPPITIASKDSKLTD